MLIFLKGQARKVKGLNTVPGLIALALWGLSLFALSVDQIFPEFALGQPFGIFYTDYDTAKSVLSTVATASITTLGLVYSIVLVVFTTAAGNIGPRLLQRFTSDPVNQFTAGLFGGTFLFALTVLHQTDPSFVPLFSIALTFFLAGLSVLQLIYFVHQASISVTIDEEVAKIADQLEQGIGRLLDDKEGLDGSSIEVPDFEKLTDSIEAESSGYITFIDIPALVELGKENDLFISLIQGYGSFIVPGIKLAVTSGKLEGEQRKKFVNRFREALAVSNSRSPDSDVEFSINLLIEIALRALSPGVNDTFTAVACIDRISATLVRPVKSGLRDHIRSDTDKISRLYLPGMSLKDLINAAFHPLRRASAENVLMTKHILGALGRLNEIGDDDARAILRTHADLVATGAKNAGFLKEDLDFVLARHKKFFGS